MEGIYFDVDDELYPQLTTLAFIATTIAGSGRRRARMELDRRIDFDVVHHVTLAAHWTQRASLLSTSRSCGVRWAAPWKLPSRYSASLVGEGWSRTPVVSSLVDSWQGLVPQASLSSEPSLFSYRIKDTANADHVQVDACACCPTQRQWT